MEMILTVRGCSYYTEALLSVTEVTNGSAGTQGGAVHIGRVTHICCLGS